MYVTEKQKEIAHSVNFVNYISLLIYFNVDGYCRLCYDYPYEENLAT